MGRLLLIRRLVTKDIRHRPAQALLLVLAIAAAATILTLGLALRGATDNPFGRTQSATNGPDVIAALMPTTAGSGNQAGPGQLAALEHALGVAAGMVLIGAGIVWSAQVPVHGHFWADLAGPLFVPAPAPPSASSRYRSAPSPAWQRATPGWPRG